jgi:protein Mpv17
MAIMEGSDPIEKWCNSFLPSYKANLTIWPLVQGVNFAFVPLELRVLVVNVVSLGMYAVSLLVSTASLTDVSGWNCLLSMINNSDK